MRGAGGGGTYKASDKCAPQRARIIFGFSGFSQVCKGLHYKGFVKRFGLQEILFTLGVW